MLRRPAGRIRVRRPGRRESKSLARVLAETRLVIRFPVISVNNGTCGRR